MLKLWRHSRVRDRCIKGACDPGNIRSYAVKCHCVARFVGQRSVSLNIEAESDYPSYFTLICLLPLSYVKLKLRPHPQLADLANIVIWLWLRAEQLCTNCVQSQRRANEACLYSAVGSRYFCFFFFFFLFRPIAPLCSVFRLFSNIIDTLFQVRSSVKYG